MFYWWFLSFHNGCSHEYSNCFHLWNISFKVVIEWVLWIKLVHFYYDIDEWELFDRLNDPNEMNNVYNDPKYKDEVEKLTEELKEMRIKYKDSEELDNSFIYKN